MIATEFGEISLANQLVYRRCRPAFASNRIGHRQFGSFRASESLDSGLQEIDQPLQVVAGRHHRHRKICLRLADGAQQFAAHLFERSEHMLDPCTRLGDAFVAPLLAFGQRLVALALRLDLVSEAVIFQPGVTSLRRVALVGIDSAARVARVEDVVKVLAVVRAGGLDLADDLVLLVDVDRELVAEVALVVLLGPRGGGVLLAPIRRLSVGGHAVELMVLHLLNGQVVQALQHEDTHHRLDRVRRTPALRADRARRDAINLSRERCEVDVRLDLGQRIAQRVVLLAVVFVSEQVSLDGASRFHRTGLRQVSGRCNFTKGGRAEVFRGAPYSFIYR